MRPAHAIAALIIFASPAQAQQPVSQLPPGEGRDIVQATCTQCHAPIAFTQMRAGPDAWRHMVYDMVLRGAQIRPAEVETIVTYLATHFAAGSNVPQAPESVVLPDGDGKALVEQLCSLCHGLDRAVGTRRTRAEWDSILARMRFLGTPAGEDQLATMTTYLNQHVGRR